MFGDRGFFSDYRNFIGFLRTVENEIGIFAGVKQDYGLIGFEIREVWTSDLHSRTETDLDPQDDGQQ